MTAAIPLRSAPLDRLAFAASILRREAEAVRTVADRLGPSFLALVELAADCRGRLIVTGIGKSADVGQKIVGTLNSTGTRSFHLDATRAMHGDLGAIHPDDVVLLLSHSGESDELIRLLPLLKPLCHRTACLTNGPSSSLARRVDVAVAYGPVDEACPMALAPSSSTTVMIALGDALAFTLSEMRQFGPSDFARYHPAGSLGKKLASVTLHMRKGADLRVAESSQTVRDVFAMARHRGRRTGAVILTHPDGTLAGLFTDSDLARLFENRKDDAFDGPISAVMTRDPITVSQSSAMGEALDLMQSRKISELPVVDGDGKPVGLLDITDVIGFDFEEPADEMPVLRVRTWPSA